MPLPTDDVLPRPLEGKVALVCGGTTGIGLAIAKAYLDAGASVAINGRSRDRGQRALDSLESDRTSLQLGDCSNADEAREVVRSTLAAHGRITTLVVSGGAIDLTPALFEALSDDSFEIVFRAQFLNRVFPIRAALPAMKKDGGTILIVGTDAGRHATVGEALHGGIGAAKIMLTKTLAREFARWNIRVNALALTITGGTESFAQVMARGDWLTHLYAKAERRFPGGRPPNVEEVARVALFFASDQSAQVTGQTLSVNGGLSFGGW